MPTYTHTQTYSIPVDRLFSYHTRRGALPYLSPPWENTQLLQEAANLKDGQAKLKLRVGPFSQIWHIKHFDYIAGEQFCDKQVTGPFKKWIHTHQFEAISENESRLIDVIEFEMPLGIDLGVSKVTKKLDQLFEYRRRLITQDLISHPLPQTSQPLRILVTGATGFIGRALVPFLHIQGHTVLPVSRKKMPGYIHWDPYKKIIGQEALEDIDAVIHLAGAGVLNSRWTEKRKKQILESRFLSTQFLVNEIIHAKKKPSIFICSSGINAYGSQVNFEADETSPYGSGFLSYVCKSWEKATHKASDSGIRTINLRTGLVLSPDGGILKRLLPIFNLGLGGPVSDGKHMLSWIAMDDFLAIVQFCLANNTVEGPVNAVAPTPISNNEFSKILASILNRPCFVRIPAMLIKLILGKQMANETVLGNIRCIPNKMLDTGYKFRHPQLEGALNHLCGK